MKRLANNLFGKRKTYDAKELGIFHSKVWNCWKNESYYWFTSMKLPVYREETFLCINGDSDAPFQPQIFCLREVLNNWEEIRSQISRIIPKHVRYIKNKEVFIYWKECFYPESVDVFGAGTNGVKITFSTYDLNHSFSFVWRDGHVRDFVLENEEKENIPYPEAYTYYLFDYLYYIGFNFLFPFLFSWVRYRKKRKSALMKHYRYPKKIKIISAIFFLLVPIVICGLEIWIYGKQGWINIVY